MSRADLMLVVLGIGFASLLVSFWRAHRRPDFQFSAFDLVMENGKVSKIALAFMLVLGVTTWIMVDLQIKGKMSEGYMTTYGAMWVFPLVAKVVFGKNDMPTTSTMTMTASTTTTSEAPSVSP